MVIILTVKTQELKKLNLITYSYRNTSYSTSHRSFFTTKPLTSSGHYDLFLYPNHTQTMLFKTIINTSIAIRKTPCSNINFTVTITISFTFISDSNTKRILLLPTIFIFTLFHNHLDLYQSLLLY